MDNEKAFTQKDIAKMLNVSEHDVKKWIETGKIKAIKRNNSNEISIENFLDFFIENPQIVEKYRRTKRNKKIKMAIFFSAIGVPPITSCVLSNKSVNKKNPSINGIKEDGFDKLSLFIEKKVKWIKDNPEKFMEIVIAVSAVVTTAAATTIMLSENDATDKNNDDIYNYDDNKEGENKNMEETIKREVSEYMYYKTKIRDATDADDADSWLEEAVESESLSQKQKEKLEDYECQEWYSSDPNMDLYDLCRGGDLYED